MSNRIILPATDKLHELSAFDVFGFFRIDNRTIRINSIESVELRPGGALIVLMASGQEHSYQDKAAIEFIEKISNFAEAALRQMQSNLVAVPPGTQIRQH